MSSEIANRLARLVERSRRFATDPDEAEEVRELEASLEHLLNSVQEAAGRGLTSLPVMSIERRHWDPQFLRHVADLIDPPQIDRAVKELKGAAAVAVQWIEAMGLISDFRYEKPSERNKEADMKTKLLLVVCWPSSASK